MRTQSKGKIPSYKTAFVLGAVCWIAYFSIYLGRLNFSASISEMLRAGEWGKAELGSVAAVFYLAYGLGQLPSGIMGDYLPAKILVLIGLGGAAVMNGIFPLAGSVFGMRTVWFMNGFAQAMVWPPMARLVTDMVKGKNSVTIMLMLSFTSPAGTLCAYLMSAVIMQVGSWKYCFWCAAVWLSVTAVFWYVMISGMEKLSVQPEASDTAAKIPVTHIRKSSKRISLFSTGLVWILAATFIQGLLKDGLLTWIPTYLTEKFAITPSFSVMLTMILPVVNLSGVYIAEFGNRLVFKNEAATAALSFGLTLISILGMIFAAEDFLYGTVVLFAVVTSMMMMVNTLFISLLPMHFQKEGKVATVSGILNAVTYVGSAVASVVFGYVADVAGWSGTRMMWCFCAAAGAAFSLAAVKKWSKSRKDIYNSNAK